MGNGLERISAGTTFALASAGRVCTVGGAGTSADWKPAGCTAPREADTRPLLSPIATPLPNPALATTPRTPFAPPVPFPEPGPDGRSKEPKAPILIALPLVSLAGTPFGSPNPPV